MLLIEFSFCGGFPGMKRSESTEKSEVWGTSPML